LTNCVEYTLGPEAIDYISDRLSYGHTLAKLLLDSIDLNAGKVVTYLPPGLTIDQLTDFRGPGVLPMPPESEWIHITHDDDRKSILVPVPKENSDLLSIIQDFLSEGNDRICIFENFPARASDPWVARDQSKLLIFGDEVYHPLYEDRIERNDIEQAIIDAASFEVIGILSSLADLYTELKGKNKITYDQLKTLSERTEKIIVGAYDCEGYLIWCKE
jgi:hypothetical protein